MVRIAQLAKQAPRLLPGVLLCAVVSVAAVFLQQAEVRLTGRAWLEALVLAILLGTVVRTVWTPAPLWSAGIGFSAKTLLEVAVALLGATISGRAVLGMGPLLLAGVAGLVMAGVAGGYALGRLLRLPHRMAALVACGNSICGNSAIAAVAPVIGAESEDVSASIAYTALLGVAVVLILPLIGAALALTPRAYGAFAGLTVYAVPQVLAATVPVSRLSAQVGALVKLVRVLMLGPVVVVLSWIARRRGGAGGERPSLTRLAPWFILAFLALLGLRSAGLLPDLIVKPAGSAANVLTVVSMAALGLGVDVRAVAKAGARVTTVATLSLVMLGVLALGLVRLAHLG
ncbi:MAG: putative sulfate exporter family transporter [Alphaproteobacteria bacterium]|nr:putative sulfate exporter family transporter [Alphaproteobacteria bacterium]